MNVTIADGQLPAAAAALFVQDQSDPTRVNVVCQNTSGATTETVTLTFKRGTGGTARRLVRAVLAPNQQLVVNGLPMEIGDTVLGASTNATTVDYLVMAAGDVPFSVTVLDANGAVKTLNGSTGQAADVAALTDNSGGAATDKTIGIVTPPTAVTDSSAGTADGTLEALPAPTDAPATADALRDDLAAVHWPILRNWAAEFGARQAQNRTATVALTDAVAELAAQVNLIRTNMRAAGLMA